MNENIDLTKILKDCPEGTELYSPIFGEVKFFRINDINDNYPIVVIDVKGATCRFDITGKLFYDYDNAECILFPSKDQRDWSKFTAPWYKKEKFDNLNLWTIQDAKNGDVIHLGIVTAIFKKYIGQEKCICYCSFCKDGGFEIPIENGEDNVYGCYNATLATKEQRVALMKAMNDVGYEWDIEKKELKKKEKFDPKTLQPFDRVLVRNKENFIWGVNIYSHKIKDENNPYWCISWVYKYCIPYNDDTKHLAGTTDEAPEYYRYWED